MRKESAILIPALLFMLTRPLQAANVRYNITDLGTLEGYTYADPLSINNDGQIVGEAYNFNPIDYTVDSRAVLFDSTGAKNNIDLGPIGETQIETPGNRVSNNNFGKIVGGAWFFNLKESFATKFDSSGHGWNIQFGIPSSATSINDNGQIVGCVITSVNDVNVTNAVLFGDFPSDYTNLGTLLGCTHSCAFSINNSGQIAGISYTEDSNGYATLFDPTGDGNNINLAAPNDPYSTAIAINDSGTIIGWVTYDTENPRRAFIFDPTGQGNNIDLGTLEGCDFTSANAINNKGQIVGFAFCTINPAIAISAVLFDPTGDGNNVNLNDLINPDSGWYLNGAAAINDNGWIAGWGHDPNRPNVPFLLTPATLGDFEPDRDVDAEDFAVLAAAWRSTPAAPNWNRFCDISEPSDDVIDEKDLKVFTENWLSDI